MFGPKFIPLPENKPMWVIPKHMIKPAATLAPLGQGGSGGMNADEVLILARVIRYNARAWMVLTSVLGKYEPIRAVRELAGDKLLVESGSTEINRHILDLNTCTIDTTRE